MGLNVQIVVDCRDPDFWAGFWAAALGYEKQDGVVGTRQRLRTCSKAAWSQSTSTLTTP